MITKFRLGIVFIVLFLSLAGTNLSQAVIYGAFGVYDYFEPLPSGQDFTSVADRTFVMVSSEVLVCGQETCVIQAESLFDYMVSFLGPLSPADEFAEFGDQPSPGFCSAFLAGSSTAVTDSADLVVTAGYCVDSDISDIAFVLGWHIDSAEDDGWGLIPLSDVYQAAEVIVDISTADNDYAVVRLDRPVPMTPLALADSTVDISRYEWVTCVGHSNGVPVKIHTNAWIDENRPELGFLTTNLDVYGGAGGAPVVLDSTKEVIGILVRGTTDWVYQNSFVYSNLLSNNDAFEEVNRIDAVRPFLVGTEPPEPTIEELLIELVDKVSALNLQQGIANSLDAKLDNATKALEDVNQDNDGSAINKLEAFINEVAAQSGKQIPVTAANELILSVQSIVDLILAE